MGPRLILSNAQKSARTHTAISTGGILGARGKFDLPKDKSAAIAVLRQPGSIHLLILPVNPGWIKITVQCMPKYRYTINTVEKQNKQGCKPRSGGFDGQLMEQSPTYRAFFGALDIALGIAFMKNPKGLQRIEWLIAVFFLALSTQVFAINSVDWTEDALLHDGRVIKVEFQATNTIDVSMPWPGYVNFQKSSFNKYQLEFKHPDTNKRIVWKGVRYFNPMLLDIVDGTPYLVVFGRPTKDTTEIYGCPELPYTYLRYTAYKWKPIPVEQAPASLVNSNLSTSGVWTGYEGRHFDVSDVARFVREAEGESRQMQGKIPKTYDEWHTAYKNSERNERKFGDCRPPSQPLPDISIPKPTDAVLEAVESSDYALTTSDEYYKSLWAKKGPVNRGNCSMLFKIADRENVMLGELFINDLTGMKRHPYTGPIPVPSGRILENRTERYCNDKFVWFVAEHEELGKTVITKYTSSGDFLYNVRIVNPKTADNNLSRSMVLDSITADNGYFHFFWDQSLPTVQGTPPQYWHRMTKFRFKEPT